MPVSSLFGRLCFTPKTGRLSGTGASYPQPLAVTHEKTSLASRLASSRLPVDDTTEADTKPSSAGELTSTKECIFYFDWDDTLFPTTWLRRNNPGNKWYDPIHPSHPIAHQLADLDYSVAELLLKSSRLGKVVVISLARPPWIGMSMTNFFPTVEKVVEKLQIPVAYAMSEIQPGDVDGERLGVLLKSRAMLKHMKPGNSSAHFNQIISVGDSCFERYALHEAVQCGRKQPEKFRVHRDSLAKTVKLAEEPEAHEVHEQIKVLHAFLENMVDHPEDFDVNLSGGRFVPETAMLAHLL